VHSSIVSEALHGSPAEKPQRERNRPARRFEFAPGHSKKTIHLDWQNFTDEKGEPLERKLVDAGIMRLRPVMITVGASVLALFPLALHGGPLWKPLCYSQIGGLGVATFITLLLVPVL
jgi:AcrB/AcrD/AcrF family